MSHFRIGQTVECVNDGWRQAGIDLTLIDLPKKGNLYRCRGYSHEVISGYIPGCLYIYLDGFGARSFAEDYFRPVIDRETDISVFKRMLAPKDRVPA